MVLKACLLTAEETRNNPVNIGIKYALTKKSEWVDITDYASANFWDNGFSKGKNYVVKNNKAYTMMKSYLLTEEDTCVMICTESIDGCDRIQS